MATKKRSKGKNLTATSKNAKSATKPAAKKAAKKPAAKSAKSKTDLGLRLTSAAPSFTVNDVEKSLAWYRDVLGFSVGERWESEGKLMGAELSAGSVIFMIGQDDWKKGRDRAKGQGVRLFCSTVQDIDQIAARIKEAGGTLAEEPKDQPWGMRDLSVDDPDGYKITIGKELKKKR